MVLAGERGGREGKEPVDWGVRNTSGLSYV